MSSIMSGLTLLDADKHTEKPSDECWLHAIVQSQPRVKKYSTKLVNRVHTPQAH